MSLLGYPSIAKGVGLLVQKPGPAAHPSTVLPFLLLLYLSQQEGPTCHLMHRLEKYSQVWNLLHSELEEVYYTYVSFLVRGSTRYNTRHLLWN